MTEHDEHIKQCQECSRNKAIADSVFVIDSDLLEELESREPRPYAPFVERLKSLEKKRVALLVVICFCILL